MQTRDWMRGVGLLLLSIVLIRTFALLGEKTSVPTSAAYPAPEPYGISALSPYPAPGEDGLTISSAHPPLPTPPAQVIPADFEIPPNPTFLPSELADTAITYVSEHKARPADVLEAVHEYDTLLPLTDQHIQVVTVLDREMNRIRRVAINLETGETRDWQDAKADEADARAAKYGKLEPILYERLEGQLPTYEVPVLIWLTSVDMAAIHAELEALYPDVDPLTIPALVSASDPALGTQVMNDYNNLLSEALLQKTEPLADYLSAQGFEAAPSIHLPAIQITLSKEMIETISKREDVQIIGLAELDLQPGLDSVVETDHAPRVWDTGIDGNGEKVAIIEMECVGKPGGDPPDWVIVDDERPGCPSYGGHASRVATMAASYHPTHPGVAPEAHVLSAWTRPDSITDTIASLHWASIIHDGGASVLNMSVWSENNTPTISTLDWALDWYARYRQPFSVIVTIAGNGGDFVASPGKAYNVITVGGIDDLNSANWSDDEMWSLSAWRDPANSYGDLNVREKPDLVAVATNLEGPGSGNSIFSYNPGTSYAAPQVAGLAALILQQSSGDPYNRLAVKAILMASATNNIIDDPVYGDDFDSHDGAGAINAESAIEIASNMSYGETCYAPCYGYKLINDGILQNGTLDVGTFWAITGEQIRVTTKWFSNSPSQHGPDFLEMQLRTEVVAPSGVTVAFSELQEPAHLLGFYAQETGIYTLMVYQAEASGEENHNHLGWAWTRIRPYDATYPKHEAPACVDYVPGSTFDVELTVRNEGYVEWVASYERLGYRWYEGYPPVGAPVAENPDVTSFGSPLFWYGDVEDVSVAPQMPAGVSPGLYTLRWDMVSHQAGGAEYWFSEQFADEPLDIPIILGSSCHAVYLPLVLRE